MDAWPMIEACLKAQNGEYLGRPYVEPLSIDERIAAGLIIYGQDQVGSTEILAEEPMGDPDHRPIVLGDDSVILLP